MKNYHPSNPNTSLVNEPFVNYYARNPQKEFDRIQKLAEETKGIVMPYLNDSYITVLQVEPHNFNSDKPLKEAQEWAEKYLIGKYTSYLTNIEKFEYQISRKAIHKYLQPSATNKSVNIFVHLSALKVLPKIIDVSIETEIHADYTKKNGVRSIENPINKDVLIHRFYGAITILDKIYRIKTTIIEHKDYSTPNKPYTFEVIEIELLDILSNNSIFGNQCTNFIKDKGFSIDTAKILQNVEKSYDKGKFLLEESKKSDAWDAIFRRF
ncbi:MAG: hypothetical protein U0L34_00195 [Paludibacteraceae bacterium]|nr:hypothetical protein [Paludibacteraceae bacterium]